METFFFFVAIGFLVYLYIKYNSLGQKQDEFTSYITKLEARIKKLELNQIVTVKQKDAIPQSEVETTPLESIPFELEEEKPIEDVAQPILVPQPTLIKNEASIPTLESYSDVNLNDTKPLQNKTPNKKPPVIKNKNEVWTKLEKQFVENWTGILGSVILVIGVGFLGIYTALKVSALGRFLLITGFAASLGGLFIYLHKKPDWLKLSLWLRSSAGAIFLIGCVGSVAIPGLKWIESEVMALTMLSLGVAVNLFLGYIGKNQGLASLHVLLSLVGVWVIPSSPTLLIVGGIVTLFGVALTYREKWDYHLLLTISSFFVFHLLYWLSLNHVVTTNNRILGIATVLIIGIAVALVHYRKAYTTKTFERIPFIVHLVNWFYFGFGLYLYSSGSKISTLFLAAGSIAAFMLAKRAKKLDISWLYHTDMLIAQFTAIISLVSLFRWQLDASFILAAIFIESLLFLLIAKKGNDALLYKIGSVSINIIGIGLLYYCFVNLDYTNHELLNKQAGSMLASAVFGTAFLLYSNKTNTIDVSSLYSFLNIKLSGKTKHPFLSIVIGFLFVSYFIHLFEYQWSVYSVVALLLVILFLREKLQSVEFALISIIFLVGSHIVNWYQLYSIQDQALDLLVVGLPILVASALSIKYSYVNSFSKHLNWIGVYLISIQLILLSYYLLYPISNIAISCAWLLLSLMALALAKLISKKSKQHHSIDRYILHTGYVLIGLFIIRHLLFNLHSKELWGLVEARIAVELLAVLVLVLWAITKRDESNYKTWKYLHPLFVELAIVFSFFAVTYEINYKYLSLAWMGMAIITFILATWKHKSIARVAVYSFCLFLLSIIQELYIYHIIYIDNNTAALFPNQDFIVASIFIVVSLSYLVVYYKRALLTNISWPILLDGMKSIGEGLNKSVAFIGVYSFAIFLLLISFYMFISVSAIIPGVIWLLLSAVIATLSLYCYGKRSNFINVDRYILHVVYLFIVAFLVRHLLVHIQVESYVGIFKMRLLIELLAIGVFVYCATLKKPNTSTYQSWDYLHPLFLELIVLFSVFTIALEVDSIWQPLVWMTISFSFALLGNSKYDKLSRLLFYSLVMYWVAAFQTAFVTSSYVVPATEVYAQPWVYGTASFLVQFIFLVYFYLKCDFNKIVLPKSLLFLTELIAKVQNRRNTYVFYPVIICTALFLFWTFDKSLLTLLWVIECLIVFVISIVLKEQHFRYVALGALAICIVRLIFFDLAQASTLNRAIVFLSVGAIMLVMNALYNKFKNRFEE